MASDKVGGVMSKSHSYYSLAFTSLR